MANLLHLETIGWSSRSYQDYSSRTPRYLCERQKPSKAADHNKECWGNRFHCNKPEQERYKVLQ